MLFTTLTGPSWFFIVIAAAMLVFLAAGWANYYDKIKAEKRVKELELTKDEQQALDEAVKLADEALMVSKPDEVERLYKLKFRLECLKNRLEAT